MSKVPRARSRSSSSRSLSTATLAAAAVIGLGACNAIFGIHGGELLGTGGSGTSTGTHGGGGATTSATGGGGTSTSTMSTSSTTSTMSTTGAGGGCGVDAGTPAGKGYQFRITNADEGDASQSCAFDSAGNLIMVGGFNSDTISFGGEVHAHTAKSDFYDNNIFVVKYGPANEYLWSKTFGGSRSAQVLSNAIAPNGDVWITGSFTGTLQIGNTLLTAQHPEPDPDYADQFVAKLDQDGAVLFAKRFGNDYQQWGMGVAVDSQGNAVVIGVGWDLMNFGVGGPVGAASEWSTYAIKLSPDGAPLWTDFHVHWSTEYQYYPQPFREVAVAIDKDDQVLFAGLFTGQTYFGDQIDAPFGGADAFVVKLDKADGSLVWKRLIHGPDGADGDQWATALAQDPCTGNVYVGGSFRGGIALPGLPQATVLVGNPTDDDMFVAALSGTDGTPLWLRTFGDAGVQRIESLTVDHAGNLLIAGGLLDGPGYQGVDFGAGVGKLGPLVAPDLDGGDGYRTDLFVLKLDATGKSLWGYRLGDGGDQLAWSIAVDASSNVAFVGETNGTLKIPNVQPYSSNYYDAFAAWLRP